jgi:hypothetical protein
MASTTDKEIQRELNAMKARAKDKGATPAEIKQLERDFFVKRKTKKKTMTAAKGGMAKKKMMRGGMAAKTAPKRMRGGGMAKMASKKKMMRGGMAKKK